MPLTDPDSFYNGPSARERELEGQLADQTALAADLERRLQDTEYEHDNTVRDWRDQLAAANEQTRTERQRADQLESELRKLRAHAAEVHRMLLANRKAAMTLANEQWKLSESSNNTMNMRVARARYHECRAEGYRDSAHLLATHLNLAEVLDR